MRASRTTARTWLLAFALALWLPAGSSLAYEPQLKSAAATLSAKIAAASKRSVAVVDFTDLQMNVTELGRFLAEELQGALSAEAKGFEVVDRTHLKAILQERKLASTGIIDPLTARKLGDIAGVDCLITGSLTPLGDSVRASIKVLDASTARVIAMVPVDIPKTEAIVTLLGRGISGSEMSSAAPASSSRRGVVTPITSGAGGTQPPVAVGDLRFEVRSCRRAAKAIQCAFQATNLGEDMYVSIRVAPVGPDYTTAFDSSGIARSPTSVRFGGATAAAYESYVRTLMSANVPTPLVVYFEETSAPVFTSVSLAVHFMSGHREEISNVVVFRNVRID
jgi:TolB-like protein